MILKKVFQWDFKYDEKARRVSYGDNDREEFFH